MTLTVKELVEACDFKPVCLPSPDRTVKGAYTGDLLSWVMGRAFQDNAWITIMSNINVIAVASLSDVSCVILSENVSLESDIVETAKAKGINVISSPLPSFETALLLGGKV